MRLRRRREERTAGSLSPQPVEPETAGASYLVRELLADEDDVHLSFEQLTAYVDCQLPPAERIAVENHTASCTLCRDDLAGLLRIAGEQPDVSSRITVTGAPTVRRRYAPAAVGLGAAAALLVAYLSGPFSPSAPAPRTNGAETSAAGGGANDVARPEEMVNAANSARARESAASPPPQLAAAPQSSPQQAVHSAAGERPSTVSEPPAIDLRQPSGESASGAIAAPQSPLDAAARSAAPRNGSISAEESFLQGWEARAAGRWNEVVAYMREAIMLRPQESTQQLDAGPGRGPVAYLPHFYLGEAYFQLGDCVAALAAFQLSEQQGILGRRRDLLQTVRSAKAACEEKGPPPPAQ
jgi:hypothetical protein